VWIDAIHSKFRGKARAIGIQEEKPLRVLHRMRRAFHARIDPDAAARIAGADEMRVAIPNLGGPGRWSAR